MHCIIAASTLSIKITLNRYIYICTHMIKEKKTYRKREREKKKCKTKCSHLHQI